MRTRVPVAHQLSSTGIEILLCAANGLAEWRWHRIIQNLDSAAWPLIDFNPKQSGMLVLATRAHCPNLAALQRFITNPTLALQFRGTDEFFNAFHAHGVAEVSITKLRRANTLLLLLDASTHF